jgi:7,8-dihydropterin-6-yl-methyl-4-(beta-D-ribofuranosyl)aminobenzene 5'-phosphate synthase
MTKLPPGFTHELRQHLSDDPPFDEVTGVPFVDLENYCCGEFRRSGFMALCSYQTT